MVHKLPMTNNLDKETIVPFGTMHRGISAIAFEGDNVMRSIFLAITTVLTVSFATAVLGVGFAAPASAATMSKNTQAKMAEMKAKDPQSYAACEDLARQRGFAAGSTAERSGVFAFIDGCMMGKQR